MATPNIPDGYDPVTRFPIQNRKYDLSQLPSLVCPRDGSTLFARIGAGEPFNVRCQACGTQYGLETVT